MTKQNRILKGAREALAFARGDCDHDWHDAARATHVTQDGHEMIRVVKVCSKFGVRVTEYVECCSI